MSSSPQAIEFQLVRDLLTLKLHTQLGIARVHLSDYASRNAITLEKSEALAQLAAHFRGQQQGTPYASVLSQNEFVLLAITSDVERIFIAGGSLKQIPTLNQEESQRFTQNMRSFTNLLRAGPLVSVSVLNGLAIGGGAEIALATDMRISASQHAAISLAQCRWGVPAGWGMMADLRDKGVYASERRRGLAVAAQEHWNYDTLTQMGLLDNSKVEDDSDDALCQLQHIAENLKRCPANLRSELILRRPHEPSGNLPAFDDELFEKHWLKEEHLKRIEDFLRQQSRSKKEHREP